ncbi:MAG: 4Fe-4S binding protein [Gemmatimonadota bacterium]
MRSTEPTIAPLRIRGNSSSARYGLGSIAAALALLFLPGSGAGQAISLITEGQLSAVFPGADRFAEKGGNPPVFQAFRVDEATGTETLVGYAFLTSDVPPESFGYTAPIRVLVGMSLEGVLTGASVIEYRESLRSSRGDFLSRPGILGQFAGKSITDPFRIRQDVQNITGASITVSAMTQGIRNAARRVAVAYLARPALAADATIPRMGTISVEALERLTWPEIENLGLARQIVAEGQGTNPPSISLAYLRDLEMAELLLGPTRFSGTLERAGARADSTHLMFLGLNGSDVALFRFERLSFVQGTDTIRVANSDFATAGILPDGRAQGEFRRAGLLLVDRALDVRRPFTIVLTPNETSGPFTAEYQAYDSPAAVASAPAGPADAPAAFPPREAAVVSASTAEATEPEASPATAEAGQSGSTGELAVAPPPATSTGSNALQFTDDEIAALLFDDEVVEESGFERTLAQTSWTRVSLLLVLLAVVVAAFVAKRPALRWGALAGTLVFLGFVDRGFLSVSHILAGISVGPDVYLTDLPLLILVSFTVVTTLFFGRVFCGFLCPFGALQDFLERVVPRRFQRELPRALHERAFYLKYGILALIVLPVVAGIPLNLFHYFEPFGTVFFWSPSLLLWAIAGGILVASAIVPRFYCRYACPLGAALAVVSVVSPFRIRRVEQCQLCKVCEQKCPTGAIRGHEIDFKECVRCNVCETQLIERAGVCRHEMDAIRPRLVQLSSAPSGGSR